MAGPDALDRAIATVLALPSFSALNRADLVHTPTFKAALRRASRPDLNAADAALGCVAEHNDDWAEACGFLMVARTMQPTVPLPPASSLAATLDLGDADAFAAGVLRIAPDERAQVANDLLMRQVDHGWRVDPDDANAVAHHAYVRQLTIYGLEPAAQLEWTKDPWATHDARVPLEVQVHPMLHDVFSTRPESEQLALADAWWADGVDCLTDLLVLLDWAGAGWATVPRSAAYFEAVTELVLAVARAHPDGLAFLTARPHLVDDFLHALTAPAAFAWLASDVASALAAHLLTLADAGLLDVGAVIAAVDEGLGKGWGGPREGRRAIEELRAALASPVS